MRTIGAAWKKATDEHYPLVRSCGNGYYGIWYLEQATIEFDVKRIDHLLFPYEGIVQTEALVKHNELSPNANAAKTSSGRLRGFKTIAEALAATSNNDLETWSGVANKKNVLLGVYKITEDAITLEKTNEDLRSVFCDVLEEYNSKLWNPIVTQPIN